MSKPCGATILARGIFAGVCAAQDCRLVSRSASGRTRRRHALVLVYTKADQRIGILAAAGGLQVFESQLFEFELDRPVAHHRTDQVSVDICLRDFPSALALG